MRKVYLIIDEKSGKYVDTYPWRGVVAVGAQVATIFSLKEARAHAKRSHNPGKRAYKIVKHSIKE